MDVKFIFILSLLLYPVLGLFLGYITRNTPKIRKAITIPIFIIGTIAIIAGVIGFSTVYTGFDFILYTSIYLSLSWVLWYIFFKKSRILAAFIMLVVFILGYSFSLALPFIGDIAPKTVIRLDDNFIYKERPISADYAGKQVEIFKVYGNFFEKCVFVNDYLDESPAFVVDTLSVKYIPENRKVILSIPQDVEKLMYTFHENFDQNWTDTLDLDTY